MIVVRMSEDHIDYVAEHMRMHDVDEVYAASGLSPKQALVKSFDAARECYTVMSDNPVCCFGVGNANILGQIGVPWLLGTDEIQNNYAFFLRGSRWWLGRMMMQYQTLTNVVDDRNVLSKRWLEWLGFDLGEPVAMGYQNMLFRKFTMERKNV